ncbi:hypothetical protein CVIRNUC_003539 [Coccomyxa viridis]|uniref:Xrn1 N-terminal domain-containing protein n=1 Tax=Coccomyxa viridis TaxID=1274662 RepID=A0AAV1I377_9CHLO|nr:hypothetical protein CVIRNUC_003539 [Coccomyxa viridis]
MLSPWGENAECDGLMIDANCMLHPCVHSVLRDADVNETDSSLHQRMYNATCEYIDHVASIVRPQSLLYIAVDGPAPRAKMNTQRHRRYKSAKMHRLSTLASAKLNLPKRSFDTNALTPGTRFMQGLDAFMRDHFSRRTAVKGVDIVLSGSCVAGEGEHKIMAYIRACGNPDVRFCVYGLDADLIFLSLSAQRRAMTLVREKVYFRKSSKNSVAERDMRDVEFDMLDIGKLREAFAADVTRRTGATYDTDKLIRDFVMYAYFLGNDFMHAVPGISTHMDGLDCLMHAYLKTLRTQAIHLVKADGSINSTFLQLFIAELASSENANLEREANARRYRAAPDVKRDPSMTGAQHQHASLLSAFENVQGRQQDTIHAGKAGWKQRYWIQLFGLDPSNGDEWEHSRRQVVVNYLEALKWTHQYYTSNTQNWHWHYRYEHSPCLSDIAEFYTDINSIGLPKTKPWKPLEQLMMVLPPDSRALLPTSYGEAMVGDRIGHMYPEDFTVYAALKKFYGECIPNLPVLVADEVLETTRTLKLSASDKVLNRLEKGDVMVRAGAEVGSAAE